MSDEMQTPNTSNRDSNETTIHGNVTPGQDFVGRDLTVQGDKVAGHKITADNRGVAANQISDSTVVTGDGNIIDSNNTVIIHRLDPSDARNQRNHKMLRQMVRSFWVDGVLKSSLYNEVLIQLNMEESPKAVDNRPWDLILKQPRQPDSVLPHSLPIIDIFDRMNQLLLILGEPGCGKTTTLLELADDLLKRAESDPTYPTPVIFNLSSWAEKRQPLIDWLVNELRTKYNIPKKIAQKWVNDDELLLLLDGLDEVKQEQRGDCLAIINAFRQEHLVPMVVCSRLAEYKKLATRLRLQGAVVIQPLTLEKINEYLDAVGGELLAMRIALQKDKQLRKMATTPLLLNIMMMAYRETSAKGFFSYNTNFTHHKALFSTYIYRMLTYRTDKKNYDIRRKLHWLVWLAVNMTKRQQSVFLIEQFQPGWLNHMGRIGLFRLVAGMTSGLVSGLVYHIAFGAVAGRAIGITLGLFAALIGVQIWAGIEIDIGRLRTSLTAGLIFGLLGGVIFGPLIGLSSGLVTGIFSGLGFIIFGIAVVTVLFGFSILKPKRTVTTAYPNQGIRQSANMAIIGLIGGIVVNLFTEFGFWLFIGRLAPEYQMELVAKLTEELIEAFASGILSGLWLGGTTCLNHIILRTLIWVYNYGPLNYVRFLDYCADCLFLRKVGGGYIFIHRMLMEHFANMTIEDIEYIAASIEASKL